MKKFGALGKSLVVGVSVLLALVIYAYGFQVTQINLDEAQDEHRQQQLFRILRALFQPDIYEYEKEEFVVNAPIYVPCQATTTPAPDPAGPYMVLTPPCAEPGAEITVEGFNFEPNLTGPLNFIPPSGVSLQMGNLETDAEGHFVVTVKLPKRDSDETQYIRAVTRRNVGSPHFSRNAIDTWNKIIETVFLALLATTFGTLFAIPLSFFAARNLMREVTSPFLSVALSILVFPVGAGLGALAAQNVNSMAQLLVGWGSGLSFVGLGVSGVLMWAISRWALPPVEINPPGLALRVARQGALVIVALLGLLACYSLANTAIGVGAYLEPRLSAFGFLGTFIGDLGAMLALLVWPVSALVGGFVLMNLSGQLGQRTIERLPAATTKILNLILGLVAGAALFAAIGAAIEWIYQFDMPALTLGWPAVIGAVLGGLLAARLPARASLPVGEVIYNLTRTTTNVLRAIESLVMVIVFAVWVGIGPFAGVLALALHTIASLIKLYSEQIESIMSGPMEAIKATGATRLQTIIYAVIPQIIPPFISYTMYRWDINVRMSTIIGFAGGGGIGFLLQQNVNLLNYRDAATQMLAIAIVVILMDYLSSAMRERAI